MSNKTIYVVTRYAVDGDVPEPEVMAVTTDLELAESLRDLHEADDDHYWFMEATEVGFISAEAQDDIVLMADGE